MSLTNNVNHLEAYIDDVRLMHRADIQKALNISRSTLHRRIEKGHFPVPAFRQGNKDVWHFKDFRNWLALQHKAVE